MQSTLSDLRNYLSLANSTAEKENTVTKNAGMVSVFLKLGACQNLRDGLDGITSREYTCDISG